VDIWVTDSNEEAERAVKTSVKKQSVEFFLDGFGRSVCRRKYR